MKFPTKVLLSVLVIGGVVSAGQVQPKPQRAEAQLAAVQKQVVALKEELATLHQEVNRLNLTVFQMQLRLDSTLRVELDPTIPHQFQRLDTSNGSFLVSLESIEPYLDGYRVVLNLGNPSAASYSGYTLKVRWGPAYNWSQYTADSYEKWQKAVREKEIPFTDSLRGGTWNRAVFIASPTAKDELGFVQVSLETKTVSLVVP
jgi:hypothetical protein